MLKFFAFFLALFIAPANAQVASHRLPGSAYPAFQFERVMLPRGGRTIASTAPTFNGNPNVIISSITGSITANRDTYPGSGQIPYFIQVSANGISGVGTSAPYEDLSYSWRFLLNGIAQCGDTFTRPTDGATVCSGLDQRGPEAAFVQRTPGTLRVELTVTGCAGSVGLVGTTNQGICTALYGPVVFTKDYTVSAYSGVENWADCNGNAGTATGAFGTPWATIAQINTALNQVNGGTQGNIMMHLKPGCAWSSNVKGLDIDPAAASNPQNIRIDCNYSGASGAAPTVTTNSGASVPSIRVNNGSGSFPSPATDIVISCINFISNTSSTGAIAVAGNNTSGSSALVSNLYFDNVSASFACDCGPNPVIGFNAVNTVDQTFTGAAFGLWNVTTYSDPTYTTTDIGEQGSARSWHFRVGGSVTGSGVSNAQSQHIYPDAKDHMLYQWVTCGPTGTAGTNKQRAYCFNGNWDGVLNDATSNEIAQYYAFLENSCQYVAWCTDLGNRTNNQATFFATGGISGTTLTVTAFTQNTDLISTNNGGSNLVSGANGGGSAIATNTRVIGSSTVNSGLCSPACTGNGGTGTYAVSISQTVAGGTQFIGADSTVQFQSVVIGGNAMIGQGPLNFQDGLSVTLRDNRYFGTPATSNGASTFFGPPNVQRTGFAQGANLLSKSYRNKVYMASGGYVNDMLYAFAGSWTAKQVITDNWTVDARSTGRLIDIPWSQFTTASSVISRNLWSSTTSFANSWYNSGTGNSFTNWQNTGGWDAAGSNITPGCPSGWTCPPTNWSHMN